MTILTRAVMHATLVIAVAGLAACDEAGTKSPVELPELETALARESGKKQGLATLRRATAAYHDVAVAIDDGFVQILPCVEHPDGLGALGIPFARLDRFDEIIDLSQPEILFYEPQENGKLRLIGAEPVVPIELWTESTPPSLFGHEFHKNEAHGLYGLHMWVWLRNPDGVFAFWHPNVSCEFAE